MATDSYIVRIYRRGSAAGKEAAGLVERVGGEARKAFSNRDELWAFLAEAPAGKGVRSRKGRPKPP